MKDFKVAGFPLPLYVLILALTAACMFTGCVPKSLVPDQGILWAIPGCGGGGYPVDGGA